MTIQVRILIVFLCCIILQHKGVYGQGLTTRKRVDGIEVAERGKKILFYQQRPKSLAGEYERASYVHPLYSMNGSVLTEDFPKDHPYHRGIFWAWHQILLNNKKIADGWTCENISWEPVKLKVKVKRTFVMIQSEMLWKSVLENNRLAPIIKEGTKIIVYKSTAQYRVLDFSIKLFPLVDNLKIGGSEDEKGYGGFCLRLKLPKNISFVSDDNEVIPKETAVEAGGWMDFRGFFDNDTSTKSGILIFCKSFNTGSKQRWILRKEASMQNVPYPGRAAVEIPKKGLTLKYRIVIHSGDMNNSDIEKLYQQYSQRP